MPLGDSPRKVAATFRETLRPRKTRSSGPFISALGQPLLPDSYLCAGPALGKNAENSMLASMYFTLLRIITTLHVIDSDFGAWGKLANSRRAAHALRSVFKAALLILAVLPQFLWFAASAGAQGASPEEQRQGLGSLASTGEVFVNDSPAPSELTLYSGDRLRTGETGMAILTINENKSFQIFSKSDVAFTENLRYFAELKLGKISVKSVGPTIGASVRAGNFVVVPADRNERTIVTTEKMPDGSYLVSCSAGNAGIISLQQAPGLLLAAGRSARISGEGQLAELEASPEPPAVVPARSAGKSNRLWIYLGLAGGGVAAGTAAAIAAAGNHPPMSPSSP